MYLQKYSMGFIISSARDVQGSHKAVWQIRKRFEGLAECRTGKLQIFLS